VTLEEFWFILIAVLWAGYFVLEGFDFGVGMLLPFVPRGERDRDTLLASIGPVWDGNEVWLVVAAGATFAAFPAWYATMFSGFYIALLLVLVLLIVRAVGFEWRERGEDPRWRAVWLWCAIAASFGVPFLWGVALASLLHGVPIDGNGDFTGNVLDLFSVYSVLAGLAVVALFAFHGAAFLTLRTTGPLCAWAAATARRLAIPAVVLGAAFAAYTVYVAVDVNDRDVFPPILPAALSVLALVAAAGLVRAARSGWAFVASAGAALLWVATLFTALYPRVMVSSSDFGNSLTVDGAASSHYALQVITVTALILTPVVLLYQAWTYHVLRERLGGGDDAPVDASADGHPAPAGAD
jgi:cytochrome d ubiquinol oxidase subunit II